MPQVRSVARAVIAGVGLLFVTATHAAAQDGRYIVKFREGRSGAGQAAVRAAGAQVLLVLAPQEAVAARIPAAALNGLSRNPNVEYIEEDVVRQPYGTWTDVSANGEISPYGISMIQADLITTANAGNRKICIIDSGYSDQHVDLRDATGTDISFQTADTGSGTFNVDSCGHGTHVAGTISAIAGNATGVIGVDPNVGLHIVKVFGSDDPASGSCGWTYSSTLVAALNSCVANGANVVTMSLGGSFKSRTEDVAFANADRNGVLSIAAAGNAGSATTSYPAGYSSVVSVAAVDANETVASFSQRNKDVELAAPGVSVLSTVPWLDDNTLSANGTIWSGGRIDGAARTSGTSGLLVNGGRCTTVGSWSGAIVLCERGDISFADKVANVQAGGGVAAAIYNNAAVDASCGVFTGTLGSAPTTNIPAVALSCADGASAVSQASSLGTVASSVTYSSSGYERKDGTSMATPHVSAVAALIWSCNPNRTNQEIRNALDASAADRGAVGRDNSYGYGIVQAKAALLRLGLTGTTCTVK